MIIYPKHAAKSYDLNYQIERWVGSVLERATGLTVTDYGTDGPRSEYDFILGNKYQFELKTTLSTSVPVELYKDEERQVPTGLMTSTAPFVVVLSRRGCHDGVCRGDVGKLRVFRRETLIRQAYKCGSPKFFGALNASECSLQYSIPEATVWENVKHCWLGDLGMGFNATEQLGYDTSTFAPSRWFNQELTYWLQEYGEAMQTKETI
jgi:hypothetical protein